MFNNPTLIIQNTIQVGLVLSFLISFSVVSSCFALLLPIKKNLNLNLLKILTLLYNRLNEFNNSFFVRNIGRLSIFVLLFNNQGIIDINSKELLYFIILLSIIVLFYNLIISLINTIIFFKKDLQLNNYFNLTLKIFKLFCLFLLLNKIYNLNYALFLSYEGIRDFFLFHLLYCIISLIQIKTLSSSSILINKIVLFATPKLNLLNRNLLPLSSMMAVNNLSNLNNDSNKDTKDKSLNIKDNTDIKSEGTSNTPNVNININAEDMVKKVIENISNSIETLIFQAASQLGLAGSISAGSPKLDLANSLLEEISNNPVELLIYGIWVLHFVVLFFLFLLLFTYISKIILSLDYQLNWLDKIFSKNNSIKIRFIALKILKTLSRFRDYNIIMLILVLIFISICNLYFYSVFSFNLEDMCNLYLKIKSEGK
jgi:hypothetical protein